MYAASSASTPFLWVVWLGRNTDTWTCRIVNITLWIIGVSRPVFTVPGVSRLSGHLQTKAVCEEWGSRRAGGGKRYRCAFARIKWCSIYMTITARRNSEGQFSGNCPRKTAEDIVRFDGSQPLQWQWKFGGHNDTTIFVNIDISDLPMPIHLCSSRLRCCQFLMSDVYIGRTLALSNWVFIIQSVNWVLVLESWNIKWSAPSFKSQLVKGWCPVYFLVDVYCLFYSTKERGKWKLN